MNFSGLQRIGYKTTSGGSYTYLTGKIGSNSFLQQESVDYETPSDSQNRELRFNAELVLFDRSNHDELYVLMNSNTEVYFLFEFPDREVEVLSTKIIVEDRISLNARDRGYLLLRFRFWIYVGAGGFNTGTDPFSPPPEEPPPFDGFDDRLFYLLENESSEVRKIHKCRINENESDWDIEKSFTFPTENNNHESIGLSASINVLRNGNIVVHGVRENNSVHLWLLDSDINLIEHTSVDHSGFGDNPDRCYIDEENSIYTTRHIGSGNYRVLKFDSQLNQIWESPNAESPNILRTRGGNVTSKFVIVVAGGSSASNSRVTLFDKNTGDIERTFINDDFFRNTNNNFSIENFVDGKILCVSGNVNTTDAVRIYDEDFDTFISRTNSQLGFTVDQAHRAFTTNKNGEFILTSDDRIYILDEDFQQLWDGSYSGNKRKSAVRDGLDRYANVTRSSDATGLIGLVEKNVGVTTLPSFSTKGISLASNRGFGMLAENWQLQESGGIPIIDPPPDPTPPPEPPEPPPVPDYAGSIEITSASASETEPVNASGETTLQNNPSNNSSDCGGSGTNKTFVQWKSTDYCWEMLSTVNKSTNATILVNHINSNVPGLSASNEGGFNPRILLQGSPTDNSENVTFLIPVAIEGNGAIFSPTTVALTGGKESEAVNEPVDIFIGGSLFATTANVTAEESAVDIAIKIFNALDGVTQEDYSFTRDGAKIDIVSSKGNSETIQLVSDAGFSFVIENIDIVA